MLCICWIKVIGNVGKHNIEFFLQICFSASPSFREGHRLKVYEGGVLSRTSGPHRDEITGSWRKLHNEGVHTFYASPNVVKMIK
jgi:hypothetical protein